MRGENLGWWTFGDHGDRTGSWSLPQTLSLSLPFPKGPFPQSKDVHLRLGPKLSPLRLPHTCDLRYLVGGFGFENRPGSLPGLCLSAWQEAGRKPAEFLSTPAPAHRAWQPMQVTAKLSLAEGQGHRGRGLQVVGQTECFTQTVTPSLARPWG